MEGTIGSLETHGELVGAMVDTLSSRTVQTTAVLWSNQSTLLIRSLDVQ